MFLNSSGIVQFLKCQVAKFPTIPYIDIALFFFSGLFFILSSQICSFMVAWGLGFWGWGLGLGIWGWDFQLMGFGACGVRPSGFFGFGLSI